MEKYIDPHLLKDNADSTHKEVVVRHLDPEEKDLHKKILADLHIQIGQRNAFKKAINGLLGLDTSEPEDLKEAFKTLIEKTKIEGLLGLKSLAKLAQETSEMINRGTIESYEDVYVFIHHELHKTGVYNKNGHLIYERSITPEERQSTIFQLNKNVSNG